jgi:BMFP domain-containing protein YqiC
VLLAAILSLFALSRFDALPEGNRQERAAATARVAALEAALEERGGDPAVPDSRPTPDASAPDAEGLLTRIAAIEARLARVEGRLQAAGEHAATTDSDAIAADEEPDPSEPFPATDMIGERHAAETGQSTWGVSTAERLTWEYADAAFFAENGGALDVDCRQSVCRLRWQPPPLAGLDGAEAMQISAMAGYELLALIAANAAGIGPIHSAAASDDGFRIEFYFARQPSGQH